MDPADPCSEPSGATQSRLMLLQIMASRLKILLMPPGRGLVPPFDQATPPDASSMAPVIMAGVWEDRQADHDLKGRFRSVLLKVQQSDCMLHSD